MKNKNKIKFSVIQNDLDYEVAVEAMEELIKYKEGTKEHNEYLLLEKFVKEYESKFYNYED